MFSACHTQKKTTGTKMEISENGTPVESTTGTKNPDEQNVSAVASPKVIVYKTKKDYSHNVPVILSDDKKTIVSYPHPKDVYYNGRLAYPTPLVDGYLLDNRGIGPNVAFLSYTYEEYCKLDKVPDINTLYKKIIDKDPITEMWLCGFRHNYGSDISVKLNDMIYNHYLEKKSERIK